MEELGLLTGEIRPSDEPEGRNTTAIENKIVHNMQYRQKILINDIFAAEEPVGEFQSPVNKFRSFWATHLSSTLRDSKFNCCSLDARRLSRKSW